MGLDGCIVCARFTACNSRMRRMQKRGGRQQQRTRKSSIGLSALRLPFSSINGFCAGKVCDMGTKSRMV